jgi:proteic killer suppression protein
MRIEFADKSLVRILTDEAHKLGLPFAIIRSARNRLIQLESATDERDLRNLKGLNFKKRKGDQDGVRSVRINDQYRIRFTISSEQPYTITILEIGDTH